MAWKMRNRYPCPPLCFEHCYFEEVRVVDGVCIVQKEESRGYLLAIGYEVIEEIPDHPVEEHVPTVVIDDNTGGGSQDEIASAPSPLDTD